MLSVRIGKSVFFYFNPKLASGLIHIGIMACSLIGPSLYFFISNNIQSDVKIKKLDLLHLLPILAVIVIATILPYQENRTLWGALINLIYWQWFIYLILTFIMLKPIFNKIVTKKRKYNTNDLWLTSIFMGVFIIWLAYKTSSYTSYIAGAVSFSFTLYITIFILIKNIRVNRKIGKAATIKIDLDKEIINKIDDKINILFNQEKLFKDSNLKMPDLAKKLGITSHLLSKYINEYQNKNFSLFINEFRIDFAVHLLKSKPNLTIEAIAYESGFNSLSTFYATFKKIKKMTPKTYFERGNKKNKF